MKEKCLAIMTKYIEMLNSGHVIGVDGKLIDIGEAGHFGVPLLQAIAADIEALPEDDRVNSDSTWRLQALRKPAES